MVKNMEQLKSNAPFVYTNCTLKENKMHLQFKFLTIISIETKVLARIIIKTSLFSKRLIFKYYNNVIRAPSKKSLKHD